MRALVKRTNTPMDAVVLDRPTPEPGSGQVLVATEACGLCGSDVHAWKQDAGYDWVASPVCMGHEAVGTVVEVGDGVDRRWIGRRVVPVSIDGCGRCSVCLRGLRQICPDKAVLGLSFDGAAAEFFVVDEHRLVPVEHDLPATVLVLTEPLSVAGRAVSHLQRADPEAKNVVVSGPGPIGLMIALLLSQSGHAVLLTGAPRDQDLRLATARSLGLATAVGDDLGGFEAQGWIEASGSGAGLGTALRTVMPGGTVVVPALFASDANPDMNLVTRREIRILGSYGSQRSDYVTAMNYLATDPEMWGSLVTVRQLEDAIDALETAAAAQAFKVVLTP
ncbi:alcohol dehydrogenase [Rhodococcus sp. 06-462-5]|uniref:zinc-dependent alcohol dehydrogenase n=1 Tax=unclassified Rhodococcus (in: high G+C Gram-positive bacteria) TaxID=192944 RepID=UPI000B9ACAEB|nr:MULTISPECIES: alcohol dehydrogenase catalytic domain-containing protein [unclassified Rhodococcus (in: high G+C Gram-positive bacteria)]OZC73622.1 alcohol dehydrogenase [Rhodococcus sp. 06-462-5]OZE63431.1 alcohol dehydrogenase [Rhodococcus sp. 02-925g]